MKGSFVYSLFISLAICLAPCASQALSTRTCNPKVPKEIKYRPSYQQCDGNAAILLSGRFRNIFSVVVKKVDHGDRLGNQCADAKCSPFKAQKQFTKNGVRTVCLGASGHSKVFNGTDPFLGYSSAFVVKWISIKLKNSGRISDVLIYCLPKPYPQTALN